MNFGASVGGSKRRAATMAMVLAAVLLMTVLGALVLGGCTSEADLVKTLSTEKDSAARQEAATDLARRHSLVSTKLLVTAAGKDKTAAAGLDALAEQYSALLTETLEKSAKAGNDKLDQKVVLALRDTIDCLACMKTAKALDGLKACALVYAHELSDAQGLQVRAIAAMGETISAEAVTKLIDLGVALGTNSNSDSLRSAVAKALGKNGEPAVAPLLPLVDTCEWADEALAEIGEPAAAPLLASTCEFKWFVLELMGADAVPVLTEAMHAGYRENALSAAATLAYIAEYSTTDVPALTTALENKDLQAVAYNYLYYIALGQAGSEQVIADALLKHGNKTMALDCWGSGNGTLKTAANKWASRHGGRIVESSHGQVGLGWGN